MNQIPESLIDHIVFLYKRKFHTNPIVKRKRDYSVEILGPVLNIELNYGYYGDIVLIYSFYEDMYHEYDEISGDADFIHREIDYIFNQYGH